MKGIPELQGAVARLLERTFLPGHAVDTGDLCISAGVSLGGARAEGLWPHAHELHRLPTM